jgi:integrase/recombinase XerD
LVWSRRYVEHQRIRNFSEETVRLTEIGLRTFIGWAEDRSLVRPGQITRPILESFQRWLFYRRKPNGKPIAMSSQHLAVQKVVGFFRYLTRQGAIVANPASDLEMPRLPKRLPRAVLTERDSEKVLAGPDITDPIELRDRAMMEVLYSTGIRRHELASLRLGDIDWERETLFIRLGKGQKDRVVPIGERALHWVTRYLEESRPLLVTLPDEGLLWVTELGGPVSLDWLTRRLRQYIDHAELGKAGAVHIWRHSMATQMLEAGCDIRHLQELLGHSETSTTAIYTRVSVGRLKAVHAQFHPASRLSRPPKTVTNNPKDPSAEDLLATLEAESDDEEPPE